MKVTSKRLIAWSIWLVAATGLSAAPPQQMQQANRAYQDGRFEEAIRQYEAVLQEGYASAALYHNLGNAWYRLGQPGQAALYYHRGLELSPGDAGLQENLAVIRAGFEEPITPLPEFFLKRWWRQLRRALGANGWAVVGLFLLWGGFAGLWRWRTAEQRVQRKKAFLAGIAALTLCVLPLALAFDAATLVDREVRGVITEGAPELYEAADTRSAVVRTLPRGAAVVVVDRIGEWTKVRLENGEIGWLEAEQFTRI